MGADIPVVALNAGMEDWKDMGVLSFFGQDDELAGEAAGERLTEEKAGKTLCVIQEQGHVGLEARCKGVASTFDKSEKIYVKGTDTADVQSTITAKLQDDTAITHVLTLGAPFALIAQKSVGEAGSKAKVATFDLNDEALQQIKDGKIEWAVDQQPYVQATWPSTRCGCAPTRVPPSVVASPRSPGPPSSTTRTSTCCSRSDLMTAQTSTAEVDDRVAAKGRMGLLFARPEVGALIGALAVMVLFMAVAPSFRSLGNTGTILYAASAIGIMAVGVSLLMVGGEFDLSTGVAATSSGIVAALTAWNFGVNVWVGVLVALVVSLAIGAFNGWLLMRTGLPSFLVTLGTFFVLQGANLAVTRLVGGTVSTPAISDMSGFTSAQSVFAWSVQVGPVNIKSLVVYWVVMVVIGALVLQKTRVGNWIFAVGGDAAAARAVGVPVKAVKIGLFMTVGFCAWMLGMHLLFSYNVMQSGEGVGNEFIYIIAAVVGGCLLTGGYGSVVGAALGA